MANLRVDKITSTETFETTGSVQFDGVDDGLTISDNAAFDLGTGDFTIEGWYYLVNAGTYQSLMDWRGSGADGNYPALLRNNTGNYIYYYVNSAQRISNVEISYDTWFHVSICRFSGITKLFIDGKEKGSFADTISYVSRDILLGVSQSNSNDLKGHISNYRVIKGRALYTSNFKPPMRELEVVPGTVLLACQSKTDASLEKTGKTITVTGNAVASELTPGILTPIVKSGGGSAITGSVEFTGSPSKLTADSVDFAMGSNDLTMECWFYNGVDTITHLLQIDTGTYQSPSDITNFSLATRDAAAGDVRFLIRNDSGSNLSDLVAGAPGAKINAWHHLAGTIEGTTTRLFLNGILIASGTISGTRTHTGQRCTIGANQTSRYLKGYLSNVRIVKGTALYTTDFIPPTRELKNIPGTVLLACQDPDNPLTEATGKTITGYGSLHEATDVEMLTNGSFASGYSTEWEAKNSANLSHANGELTVTSTQNYSGVKVKSAYLPSLVAGRKYVMTINLKSITNSIRFGVVSGATKTSVSTAGRHTLHFTGQDSTSEIFIEKPDGSNSTFVLKSVSIRELNTPNRASNFTPQVGDNRKVTFEGVTKVNSDAYFYLPTGDTESRETTGTYNAGTRAIYHSGESPTTSNYDTIEYLTIATLGSVSDFGNLTNQKLNQIACSSNTRGLFATGYTPSPASGNNFIDFVTIMSTGNALDFGDLSYITYVPDALSNQIRGIFAGGAAAPSYAGQTNMDYVTIASKGNGRDFGDLSRARHSLSGLASPTRGVFASGNANPSSNLNNIDYITIATTGNAQDFGDIGSGRAGCAGASSVIRGLFAGGYNPTVLNSIDFITIATTGNTQDFGDLTAVRRFAGATSSSTRGIFIAGFNPSATNTIDFVSIQTTGNATDFGDTTINKTQSSACSNGHGGLG